MAQRLQESLRDSPARYLQAGDDAPDLFTFRSRLKLVAFSSPGIYDPEGLLDLDEHDEFAAEEFISPLRDKDPIERPERVHQLAVRQAVRRDAYVQAELAGLILAQAYELQRRHLVLEQELADVIYTEAFDRLCQK